MEGVWFRHRPDSPWIVKGHTMRFEAVAEQHEDLCYYKFLSEISR
jgi:hypothetical protein